ncbi:hypothetical protein [Streptomyces syringium]|uniref:hypothetical protein n=1 Tax=Streptomyces syringium TaxID=76729 RepID=UPI0034129E46
MRIRRAAAAATLFGLLTTLAGCGIEPTEVIDVGYPATGAKRPGVPATQAVLYFAYPGGVVPVSRPAGDAVSAEDAVPLLLKGPNEPERLRGYYSELPKVGGVDVITSTDRVVIRLGTDVSRLTRTARNQLVCTAAHNGVPGKLPADEVKVSLVGGGKSVTDQVCASLFPQPGRPGPSVSPVP